MYVMLMITNLFVWWWWKLYTPGPGESLSNFEVHLKNREHRRRVNERVVGGVVGS
ncbi:hypothetical protein BDZ94DRAFT_1249793 [Collybia nuda]|uniref:ATP synthase F0 subunit 8 n=1 Tax=Collybia nuda TaxID=64659 RepID=A0A9P6CNP4_9AGAR|nr:hypothetical protein BDZ94DRAFT_1249793 [Collybia nuda]